MKQLILVDSVNIGDFLFQGYILEEDCKKYVAYGIFVDTIKNPLVCFRRNGENTIGLSIDEALVEYISKKSAASIDQREQYFNAFLTFVVESEKKAAYMAFKGRKMEYLSNSKYLVQMRNVYLGHTDSVQ
ncbi:hypothetical protein G5B00_06450 [Parapedobacter sp. SGR-10]|uniref:hypothetical protein n=1 Tax=Parapedobacter sp. SGR-10 TaxID=2710879 RepID=UPI0013CF531D|nr:hypothetical protein [Parapedobacter sp. SGR-10]NGF56150.1 hypothetical protein [Parapedobacter sp. SGR-10]